MKVTIDATACVGCGLCESNCPDVFEMGKDGIAHVKNFKETSCNVKEAAEQCPVNCIKVE